jgi:hypothetical protein
MNGSSKLECYVILGWKVLPGTNTQAYWVPFVNYEESKVL